MTPTPGIRPSWEHVASVYQEENQRLRAQLAAVEALAKEWDEDPEGKRMLMVDAADWLRNTIEEV
jgi:hypothetical protein